MLVYENDYYDNEIYVIVRCFESAHVLYLFTKKKLRYELKYSVFFMSIVQRD